MKRGLRVMGPAGILWLVLAGSAATGWAQEPFPQWRGSGGWGAGLPYNRLYDSGRTQTLEGVVAGLFRVIPEGGMADGLGLSLRTRDGMMPVHLGPLWFLERQDLALIPGMEVTVTGTQIDFQGRPALLATAVRRPDKNLLLRDRDGFPLWTAWRRD